jgi:hypothetical protein
MIDRTCYSASFECNQLHINTCDNNSYRHLVLYLLTICISNEVMMSKYKSLPCSLDVFAACAVFVTVCYCKFYRVPTFCTYRLDASLSYVHLVLAIETSYIRHELILYLCFPYSTCIYISGLFIHSQLKANVYFRLPAELHTSRFTIDLGRAR